MTFYDRNEHEWQLNLLDQLTPLNHSLRALGAKFFMNYNPAVTNHYSTAQSCS
jgi:hypothetical protein